MGQHRHDKSKVDRPSAKNSQSAFPQTTLKAPPNRGSGSNMLRLWDGSGRISEDGDPNFEGSVEGITRPNCRYSIVYVEVVRDAVDLSLRPPSLGIPAQKLRIERNKSLTAAHEIGHMPGGGSEQMDHDEGNLMSDDGYDGGLTFSSRSIRRFRNSRTWQQSKH